MANSGLGGFGNPGNQPRDPFGVSRDPQGIAPHDCLRISAYRRNIHRAGADIFPEMKTRSSIFVPASRKHQLFSRLRLSLCQFL